MKNTSESWSNSASRRCVSILWSPAGPEPSCAFIVSITLVPPKLPRSGVNVTSCAAAAAAAADAKRARLAGRWATIAASLVQPPAAWPRYRAFPVSFHSATLNVFMCP